MRHVIVGNKEGESELIAKVMPQDLHRFGMIPELLGRIPVITSTRELGELLIGKSLVVLGCILDLEQVNNVDEASLDAQLAKHVRSSWQLLTKLIACKRN